MMELQKLLESNIRQAVLDYGKHSNQIKVLTDVSDAFVEKLAEDAVIAKGDLRDMLRKSPAWDEGLQAVVINGTRTHNPDYHRVHDLALKIIEPYMVGKTFDEVAVIHKVIAFFANPTAFPHEKEDYIDAIKQIAPKAYRANRKKSRIFKNICDILGLTDESAGSDFQRLFAQFADELSGKKIDFKLFLSINPAHFITMSNPKNDMRGKMLISCHSFNSTEYDYVNGCSGYARDDVTMIAFTVDDPTCPELLNNRKTTRQLFMYKVGNGLLLQSRMYNSSGGVYGASELTPLYRDLVQREISELEGVPNLWKTYTYHKNRPDGADVKSRRGFGGYPDWEYSEFDPKISIRADHNKDFKAFEIGNYGLCIKCGKEISEGLYCRHCGYKEKCECCGDYVDREEMYTVHNSDDYEIQVCGTCFDRDYMSCSCCREYYPVDSMTCVNDDEYVCRNCLNENYFECEDCGNFYYRESAYFVYDENGNEAYVCDNCIENYVYCENCTNYVHESLMVMVNNRDGEEIEVCESCRDNDYEQCDNCGEYYPSDLVENGFCSNCADEDEEELA